MPRSNIVACSRTRLNAALAQAPWPFRNAAARGLHRPGTGARPIQLSIQNPSLPHSAWVLGFVQTWQRTSAKPSTLRPGRQRGTRQPPKLPRPSRRACLGTVVLGQDIGAVYMACSHNRQCRSSSWHRVNSEVPVPMHPTAPNHSVKASPNGMPPGPGRRYAVHFRQPGPGVMPSAPPYLER